jgi:hypothetical protein
MKKPALIHICLVTLSFLICGQSPVNAREVSIGFQPGIMLGFDYLVKASLTPHVVIPINFEYDFCIFIQPEFSFINLYCSAGIGFGNWITNENLRTAGKGFLNYWFLASAAFCVKFADYFTRGFTADNIFYGIKLTVPLLMLISFDIEYFFNGTNDMEKLGLGFGLGF